ncbi:GGDEF domain-containing protein [Halobacillus litoralis]|uniref:GGDEF domain-containing protein n=1 Tax=Halobacillus litoralis TaxID=45668 RepID=UPI001CD35FF8|nr:GGDEF domain-containing protein [Halobacillus litoralis]MCA0970717.1 GGDEF domain-containing protein [Halobacillus litoralis]
MQLNYITIMFFLYILLGAGIGIVFSMALPAFIPVPDNLLTLFTASSILAGVCLGLLNFALFFFFTRTILSYFHRIFRSIEEGDFSVRSHLKSSGYLSIFSSSVNRTLSSLEETQTAVSTDVLTGVSNRSAFQKFMLDLKKKEAHYHLYFLDLDGFKKINDTYGHAAGDEVLRHFARSVGATLTQDDGFFRYGGDEFIVIQRDEQGQDDITRLCRAFKQALETPCNFEGQSIHIDMSVGVTSFRSDAKNLSTILDSADSAMYRAKKYSGYSYTRA